MNKILDEDAIDLLLGEGFVKLPNLKASFGEDEIAEYLAGDQKIFSSLSPLNIQYNEACSITTTLRDELLSLSRENFKYEPKKDHKR